MRFEWDGDKDKVNIKKHGLPLVAGIAVWNDDHRKEFIDTRENYGEDRMMTIGMGINGVLFVCWTERDGETIRLISVRKATKQEKALYNGND